MAQLRVKKKGGGRWLYPVIVDGGKEINIKKTDKVVIVIGGQGSNKSDIAKKLYDVSEQVYGLESVFISGFETPSFWRQRNNITKKGIFGHDDLILLPKNRLLIIDDLDKIVSGSKYHLMMKLLKNAHQIVVFISSIELLNNEIKTFLYSRSHSLIKLSSSVPQSEQKTFLWGLSAVFAAMGIPDILGAVMAWKFFGRGK